MKDQEKVNKDNATVVNTNVSSRSVSSPLIKCLFYGVVKGKYQLCKSLDDQYVIIFEDGKDAMNFKMSKLEDVMKSLETEAGQLINTSNLTTTGTNGMVYTINTSGYN